MLQLDNDFASRGVNAREPTNTSMGFFPPPQHPPGVINGRKNWKDKPDRFLRGGNEDQPEGFKTNTKEESTGGSSTDGLEFSKDDNEADEKSSYQQYFKRDPLITQTQTLYNISHILNSEQNNQVNRMNFYFEIALTVSTFLSSFLILTIEKNWWGGYLTSDKNSHVAHNFKEWQ